MRDTSHSPSPSEISISVVEAARRTGLGRTSIYAAMSDGLLPWCKVGGRRLILVDDLRSLLTANRQTSDRKAA
jgi:excisionase family DNA binding protein